MKHRDHSCQEVWERSLDVRRGDLSELETLRLEEEIAHCEHCAQRVGRITSVLDQAAQEEPAHWLDSPLDADALFDRIEAELESQGQNPDLQEAAEQLDPDMEHASEDAHQANRSPWLWIAVAASLLLGLGAGLLWGQLGHDAAPGANSGAPVAQRDPWTRQGQTPPSVGLYARSDARWELTGQQDYTLRVSGGELLVDFTPLGEDTLKLQVGQLKARVVGTVVYIKATDPAHPEVGVLTGAVEVQTPAGTPVLLRDGQSTHGPLPQSLTQETDALLDLERHRQLVQRLRQAKAAKQEPAAQPQEPQEATQAPAPTPEAEKEAEAPKLAATRSPRRPAAPTARPKAKAAPRKMTPKATPKAVPRPQEPKRGVSEEPTEAPKASQASKEAKPEEPKPSPKADLPTQARRALGRRDYREAARLHEAWLRTLPTHSGQAATVRLELTRLYLRKLNRRADAIGHLRGLLRDNSNDPIAVEARAQLCGLLGTRAAQDPACR